ncbi:hypothetical protein GJ496_004636 [Pomphorhynchus laevis]|nr:hypothetical protein GJ496_004636 [Pomphorhynchus laevis]
MNFRIRNRCDSSMKKSSLLDENNQRTDYTYARTTSYLPPALASPQAENMIPNMKRHGIRKHNSSADTSTSHRCDSEVSSIHSQRTIPVTFDNERSSGAGSIKCVSDYQKAGNKKYEHNTDGRRFGFRNLALRTLKYLFWIAILIGCLTAAFQVFIHPGKFNVSNLKQAAKITWFENNIFSRNFDDDKITCNPYVYMQLKKEVNKLKEDIIQLKSNKNRCGCDIIPNTYSIENNFDSIPDWFVRYDNDRTGLLDFASAHMGGVVYSVGCTKPFQKGFFTPKSNSYPDTVLNSNMDPGNCWSFSGNNGSLVIKLKIHIHPTGFTYEHIDRSISLYKDNSPREITIKAFSDTNVSDVRELGTFHFNWNTSKLQTWTFQHNNSDFQANFFDIKINSNWGNVEQTCLYRIRIHGNT